MKQSQERNQNENNKSQKISQKSKLCLTKNLKKSQKNSKNLKKSQKKSKNLKKSQTWW